MISTQSKTAAAFVLLILVFSVTHFATFPGSVEYFNEAAHNQALLDLKPEFSADKVYERLDNFGNDGRAAYLKLVPTIDLIFPISAFIFFLIFGRLAAEKYGHSLYSRYYWILPSTYLLMDFLENAFVVLLLLNYPERLDVIASVLGFISVTKRVFMIISFGLPLLLLSLVTLRRIKQD